jgi:peptidoglycan/xylan/chitin deacetylase (PgdA/CDA1 family)
VGQQIYHERQAQLHHLHEALGAVVASKHAERFPTLEAVLLFIEQDGDLYDADRLAFREPLRVLGRALAADGSLTAVKLHKRVTEDLDAILKQDQVPGLFFHVGRNLGKVDGAGQVKLGPLAEIEKKLVAAGYVIGNHSYTHAQLSKETGDPLKVEIGETDTLLKAIPGVHSDLFRFPYGARTEVQLDALQPYHLRSILWNIDSLDWADPLPSSIVNRVLKEVDKEKKGILLFHDIHERAVKALPQILDKLIQEGYAFAGWDGQGFKVVRPGQTAVAAAPPPPATRRAGPSWWASTPTQNGRSSSTR